MLKVLFLDFDGVLNTISDTMVHGEWLDAEKVQRLNELVDLGVDVVISSAWRIKYSEEDLADMLASKGLLLNVIGVTPILPAKMSESPERPRLREIHKWLEDCGQENVTYAILDDLQIPSARLVRTSIYRGLGRSKIAELKKMFEK